MLLEQSFSTLFCSSGFQPICLRPENGLQKTSASQTFGSLRFPAAFCLALGRRLTTCPRTKFNSFCQPTTDWVVMKVSYGTGNPDNFLSGKSTGSRAFFLGRGGIFIWRQNPGFQSVSKESKNNSISTLISIPIPPQVALSAHRWGPPSELITVHVGREQGIS